MSTPTHCQTCGEPIGHLWRIYLELVEKYAKEPNKKHSTEYLARQELIDKHNLDGYKQCCLYAHIVNHDLTNLIT